MQANKLTHAHPNCQNISLWLPGCRGVTYVYFQSQETRDMFTAAISLKGDTQSHYKNVSILVSLIQPLSSSWINIARNVLIYGFKLSVSQRVPSYSLTDLCSLEWQFSVFFVCRARELITEASCISSVSSLVRAWHKIPYYPRNYPRFPTNLVGGCGFAHTRGGRGCTPPRLVSPYKIYEMHRRGRSPCLSR